MDPIRIRRARSLLCLLSAALACGLAVLPGTSAASGQIHYARLAHACPPPQAGDATCFAVVRRPVAASASAAAGVHPYVAGGGSASSGPAGGLTPADLASAYNYDPTGGSGQTVAIVDAYDDPRIEEDLATFDGHYGLGECTKADGCFRKVNQYGSESQASLPPTDETGWSQEISLDVEIVRAVCRGCKILLVEAESAAYENLARAVDEAVALGATEVSNSYGGPEEGMGTSARAAYDHPGVVITGAGGDYGYDDWNYPLLGYEPPGMPNAPASLPTVVSVGGTSLRLNENGTRASETVWNDDGPYDENELGAGYVTTSGCSTLFTAEPWQQDASGFSATGCGNKRLSVDVSADGDPLTGFDIYDNFNYCKEGTACHEELQEEIEGFGGWETFGGTSVGTPLIASLYALAGGANGVKYPALTLYGHLGDSASLYDVTEGSDGICDGEPAVFCGMPNAEGYVLDCEGTSACNARSGYDGPSGVGTPNGLEAFTPLFPTAVITPPESAHAEVPASFNGSRSTDPYPGGSVASYSWNWGDGTAESAGVAPTHAYSAPGDYTVTLTVTDNYGLVSLPVSEPVTVVTRTAKELEERAARKAEEEATRKATEEAAKKAEEKKAEEKKAEEKRDEEKRDEEKRDEEKRDEEEAAAHVAAVKRQEEEAAALTAKRRQEEEAARIQVLGIKEGSPDATIADAPLRASAKGLVMIRISCPAADTRCNGTVTLRTLRAVRADLAAAAGGKPAIVTLGTGSFALAGGKVATVALHLSAKVRAFLERSHELRVRVTILDRDPAGATHTGQVITTLIAPKRAH